MIMAGAQDRLNLVENCQLGKIGSGGVALKINFVTGNPEPDQDPCHSVEFGMSREVARGLAKALMSVLDESTQAEAQQTRH
jgi:hypothetical protein